MPNKKNLACLNGLQLKILAVVTMTCDHAWACGVVRPMLFTMIGRLAFPIFAFLVAEGARRTRNLTRYLLRMVLFAVISEIPFNLMSGGTVLYPYHQNVLWTFALALVVIWLSQRQEAPFLRYFTLAAGAAFGYLIGTLAMVDYLGCGVLTVLLFYVFHELPFGWVAEIAGVIYINCVALAGMIIPVFGLDIPLQGLASLALIPILLYNGQRGYGSRLLQIGFYTYYPAHILILALLGLYVM